MQRLPLRAAIACAVAALLISPAICQGQRASITVNSSLSTWRPIAYFVDGQQQPRQSVGETRTFRRGSVVRWHIGTPDNEYNSLRLATGRYRFTLGNNDTLTLVRNSGGGTATITVNSSLSTWRPIAYSVDGRAQPRQSAGQTRTVPSGSTIRWHLGTSDNEFDSLRVGTGSYRFLNQDGVLTLTQNNAGWSGGRGRRR